MTDDIRAIRQSAAILVVLALFVTAYFARDVILPIMLGVLIALTLSPINRAGMRRGVAPAFTATVLIFLLAAAIAATIVYAGGTLSSWVDNGPELLREVERKLGRVSQAVAAVQEASEEVEGMGDQRTETGRETVVVDRNSSLLYSAVSTFTSVFVIAFVALVIGFFLLASGDMFHHKIVQSFDQMADKKRALATLKDIETIVSRYLFTITLINAGLGVAVGAVLWLLGLDNAYVWGIAAFLLNFLPYIGGMLGMVMVGVYAIVSFDSLSYALLCPLAYQALTTLEGQFITPWLVGRRLKLNPVAVLLTVVVWAWLWGFAGALVAVPVLLVFKVFCDHIDRLRIFATLLGPREAADEEHQPRDATAD